MATEADDDIPIAHVRKTEKGEWIIHPLHEHLLAVARMAGCFARPFGAEDWAALAGLWHDLGKYRSAFQHYIRSKSGYDPEAHIEGGTGRVLHGKRRIVPTTSSRHLRHARFSRPSCGNRPPAGFPYAAMKWARPLR